MAKKFIELKKGDGVFIQMRGEAKLKHIFVELKKNEFGTHNLHFNNGYSYYEILDINQSEDNQFGGIVTTY